MHKSILKQKNWRKQNQPGIKFYNIECVVFTFGTFWTEISQNKIFPHFQQFQIFAQVQNKICSQIKNKVETNVSQFYWTAMPSLTGPSGWWVVMRTNGVEFSRAPTWLMFSNLKSHFPLPAKRRGRKGRRKKVKVTRTRTAGLMVLKAKGPPSWLRHLLDQHSANNITL